MNYYEWTIHMSRDPLKLTPLGIMLLALLHEDDMHPYEMLCLLQRRRRDRFVTFTKGALYHTVARLGTQQYIAETTVDREGNRPERTTYTLLDSGREAVATWVRDELPRINRPSAFSIALAEAHNLPREEVIALLTARKNTLAQDLNTLDTELTQAQNEGTPSQYLLNFEREVILLDADLRWNTAIVAHISSPTVAWGCCLTDPPEYQLH